MAFNKNVGVDSQSSPDYVRYPVFQLPLRLQILFGRVNPRESTRSSLITRWPVRTKMGDETGVIVVAQPGQFSRRLQQRS